MDTARLHLRPFAGAPVRVLRAAFERWGLAEVVAVADPRDPASVRVLEKIGMRRAGQRMGVRRRTSALPQQWSDLMIAVKVSR